FRSRLSWWGTRRRGGAYHAAGNGSRRHLFHASLRPACGRELVRARLESRSEGVVADERLGRRSRVRERRCIRLTQERLVLLLGPVMAKHAAAVAIAACRKRLQAGSDAREIRLRSRLSGVETDEENVRREGVLLE